jgi:hypothetical protein
MVKIVTDDRIYCVDPTAIELLEMTPGSPQEEPYIWLCLRGGKDIKLKFTTEEECRSALRELLIGNKDHPTMINGIFIEQQWNPSNDPWASHDIYTAEDWAYECTNNDTRLGYVDWVRSMLHDE